jgi:hypothetical protein
MAPFDLRKMWLRPATVVLDRPDDVLQVGTDPRWALTLRGLDESEREWIHHLALRREAVNPEALARHHEVGVDRAAEIAALLAGAGLLVRRFQIAKEACVAEPEIAAAALLRADGNGRRSVADRRKKSIAVVGLGRLGAAVVTGLATAGVGHLIVDDDALVQVSDVGMGGYEPYDIGKVRSRVLTSRIPQRIPDARCTLTGRPDLVIAVQSYAINPDRLIAMMGTGVVHVPVSVREATVAFHLVIPGTTACARCLDLTLDDADPAWPMLKAQLLTLGEIRNDVALAASGAAAVVAQVLTFLDGGAPAASSHLVEVALPQGLPTLSPLVPHPECGCSMMPVLLRSR